MEYFLKGTVRYRGWVGGLLELDDEGRGGLWKGN
jgi:hypothetical protein